ncbi:hypothetical protein GCM10028801_30660 [Nocardioides maradonensis]
MATNQELFELVMRLNPGSTASDIQSIFKLIADGTTALSRQKLEFGQVDTTQVERSLARIRQLFKESVESHPGFSNLGKDLQEQLLRTIPDVGVNKIAELQSRLSRATTALAEANAKERASRNTSGIGYVKERDLNPYSPSNRNIYRVEADTSAEGQRKAKDAALAAAERYSKDTRALLDAINAETQAHIKAAAAEQKAAEDVAKASFAEGQRLQKAGLRSDAADRQAAQERLAAAKLSFAESQRLYRSGLDQGAGTSLAKQETLRKFQEETAVPYYNPNTATALGRAQEQANQAVLAQAAASRALAAEQEKANPNLRSLISAWNQERRAAEQLAAANVRIRALSEAPPTGLAAQFGLGFRGKSGDPYAVQLGQAAKFSLLYGTAYKALFAFTQTLQQTLQEGIQFEQAVSELKLATNQSADAAKSLANQLGEQAANAGFSPSEGALAGARAIGLYGAADSTAATQNNIARISTDVATKLAFNSGMQIQDVQTSLAAITNAFQLGYAGQGRIADLDAYFSHKFGVAPGQTVQSVAESGSVAQQAGFTLDQTTAIAALLQGRTGQSADAVAGWMAQIFSRAGEGSLGKVASKYGIDSSETLAKQLAQLAQIYKTASPNEQNQIAAAFGRGKVQNAVSVLLGSFSEVSRAADDASKGLANGAADKAFSERMNNLGGQLQLLLSSFKEFANLLGQSGVLGGLGLLAEGLRRLLDSANGLLRAWDEIPGTVRTVVASLALLALASRSTAGQSAISSILGAGGLARASTLGGRAALATEAGAVVPIASRAGAGALAGAAGGALLAAGPWIAAIGGLVALGELANAASSLGDQMKAGTDALKATTEDLKTSDQWAASADALKKQATASGAHGFWQNVYAKISGNDVGDDAIVSALQTEAERRKALADRLAKIEDATAGKGRAPLITAFDADSLNTSLQQMADSGASAQQQFQALRTALLGAGAAADAATHGFDRRTFAGKAADSIANAVTGTNAGPDAFTAAALARKGLLGNGGEQISGKDAQDLLLSALRDQNIKTENLNPTQLRRLAAQIVDTGPLAGIMRGSTDVNAAAQFGAEQTGLTPEQIKAYRQSLLDQIFQALSIQTQDVRDVVSGLKPMSNADLNASVAALVSKAQAALSDMNKTDYNGPIKQWRQTVEAIHAAINKQVKAGGGVPAQVTQALHDAEKQLVTAQIARLEQLRKVAQQNAIDNKSGRGVVASIGKGYWKREIDIALKHGQVGQDALVGIVEAGGKAAKNAVIAMIKQDIATIKAMDAIQQKILAAAVAAVNPLLGLLGASVTPKDPQVVTSLQQLLGALQDTTHGASDTYLTGSDVPGYKPPTKDPKQSRADRIQKMLAIRASLRQLSIDMTDPLAEARVAVADALDRVKHALNREDRLAAQVDLKTARNNLEATKFSQRLQDMQTADELGRISHLKYMSYLDHEHDRLNAIKHRTRQQQDELDQIDQLIKSANTDLQGQWNFGDITLPTPYQVKRRVEELYGNIVNPSGSTTGGNTPFPVRDPGTRGNQPRVEVHINGADTAKVKEILRELTRGQLTTRTTTSRHR